MTDLSQKPCILFDTQTTQDGFLLGIATLNDPKALNALSVEMCQRLSEQLNQWDSDSRIVAVILRGAGDKAFCAGGNIRKLYDSMCDNPPFPNPYAQAFFGNEYALYRQMHFYHKPLILWGSGIVMGGGLGLMANCSHRIVTETTRFAMPEITIGLFPDATGSWFLQRMPAKTGLFLGLTGAVCHAQDALLVNLAEYAVISDGYEDMIQALIDADWSALHSHGLVSPTQNAHDIVSQTLGKFSHNPNYQPQLSASKLAQYWQVIHNIMNAGGLVDIDELLQHDDKLAQFLINMNLGDDFIADDWAQKALATYRHGCPVTAVLTYELFYKVKGLSLAQILYLETNIATHCANNPDFKEGVRALLIDKDKSPTWSKTLADCLNDECGYVLSHFRNPYGDNHPFANWVADGQWGDEWFMQIFS